MCPLSELSAAEGVKGHLWEKPGRKHLRHTQTVNFQYDEKLSYNAYQHLEGREGEREREGNKETARKK